MQFTREITHGRVELAAGTLYGAIKVLLEHGWIVASQDGQASRKKQYLLTSEGREVLKAEIERLEELVINGKAVLDSDKEYSCNA